jgi:RNA polymerase sigma-70 factor (ECF subfamily)
MTVDDSLPAEFIARLPEVERKLVAAVRRCCPPWLSADADDLVQAAMIKVLDRTRRDPAAAEVAPAYLWRIAYSAVVDEIRRRRRRREVPLEIEGDGACELPSPTPGPDRWASSRALGAAIADCLGRLLPVRRQAVTLHLLGHTIPEIADLLDWSAKRADNNVYRGLTDLRRCLDRKGVSP